MSCPSPPQKPTERSHRTRSAVEYLAASAPAGPTAEVFAARTGRVTYKTLTKDATLALVRRYQEGDRNAGEVLLHAHDGWLCGLVKHFSRTSRIMHDLAYEDLRAEAQAGFLVGVKSFDPTRGIALLSYSLPWVNRHLRLACSWQGFTIRTPATKSKTAENVELRRRMRVVERLDAPLTEDGTLTLASNLKSDAAPADSVIADRDDLALLRRAVAEAPLTPRERHVLDRRYLSDDPPTNDVVGAELGVSRERVRQLEAIALAKVQRTFHRLADPTHPQNRPADS